MAPRGREVEEALITWINVFTKELPFKARTLADLTDGAIFHKILERLDSAYATDIVLERVTSSSKWLAKKKNLGNVHKSLVRYIHHHCSDFPPGALQDPVDLNAVAEYNDVDQTMKLTTIFLMAAIHSKKEEYIREIQALDQTAQVPIVDVIESMTNAREESKLSNLDDAGLPPTVSKNLDLAIEEEFAKLTKQHETLTKKHADERTNNERLQITNEELRGIIGEKDTELEQFRGINNEADTNYIANLKNRLREQEILIDTLEGQVTDHRDLRDKHLRELALLRPLQVQVQELQDEKAELQATNNLLAKKANKVDHYERKLQAQVKLQRDFDRLRETNSTLENNMAQYDKVHALNQRLQQESEIFRSKIQQYEMDMHAERVQRDYYQSESATKDAQIQQLVEQKAHDESFIATLQEPAAHNENQRSPDSPSAGARRLDLETELQESEGHQVNFELEISRLRAENQLLKDSTVGTTNLRVDREHLQALVKRLQTLNQELMEKHAIGQEQLYALLDEQTTEKLVYNTDRLLKIGPLQYLTEGFYRNESVSTTKKLWLDATFDLDATKAVLAELHMKLTESGRQLLAATSELNALDQGEVDALEELRSANDTITAALQSDLLILQGEHKSLRTDYEQQKTQLNEALLAKDKALADLANLRDMVNINDQVLYEKSQTEKKLKEDKNRNELNEHINKQEVTILDLQQKLKLAADNSPDAQKAKHEAIIKNLMRENALITTAWYDLSSRLQSNNVVLQRRQDAPKSWLNRQRQMINATPRR